MALALSRGGFGDSLVNAADTLPEQELLSFLIRWRSALYRELVTDSHGFLGRIYVPLAHSLPDVFPAVSLLFSYTSPVTSSGLAQPPFSFSEMKPRQPNLTSLASVCGSRLSWRTAATIQKQFQAVWEGACLQMLCQVCLSAPLICV